MEEQIWTNHAGAATLSFEVFPPKTEKGMEKLHTVMDRLYRWNPAWISCTYGAGGSNKGYNLELCRMMAEAGKTMPVTHYTCIHHTREEIRRDIREYLDLGVDHILALRGDFLEGEHETHGDFQHSSELIAFLREEFGRKLTIACSGIPEGHILSETEQQDLDVLKLKQELGADYIITQLTYNMEAFQRWLDAIRGAGIDLPVAVGIMPVLDRDKCIRHCLSMNGTSIPRSLARHISRYYDDPEGFRDAGIDYTIQQMEQFRAMGVDDLHVYALNQADAVDEILTRWGYAAK